MAASKNKNRKDLLWTTGKSKPRQCRILTWLHFPNSREQRKKGLERFLTCAQKYEVTLQIVIWIFLTVDTWKNLSSFNFWHNITKLVIPTHPPSEYCFSYVLKSQEKGVHSPFRLYMVLGRICFCWILLFSSLFYPMEFLLQFQCLYYKVPNWKYWFLTRVSSNGGRRYC